MKTLDYEFYNEYSPNRILFSDNEWTSKVTVVTLTTTDPLDESSTETTLLEGDYNFYDEGDGITLMEFQPELFAQFKDYVITIKAEGYADVTIAIDGPMPM